MSALEKVVAEYGRQLEFALTMAANGRWEMGRHIPPAEDLPELAPALTAYSAACRDLATVRGDRTALRDDGA